MSSVSRFGDATEPQFTNFHGVLAAHSAERPFGDGHA
jgi:hypothetical protein